MESFKYIFGPIQSKRLGTSLGIDIVPYKACTFNCIYCQLGATTTKTTKRFHYSDTGKIKRELRLALSKNKHIDFITLAGCGEPTLNLDIAKIITAVKSITKIPVAILTNGSLLYRQNVRRGILKADVVMPSLDAAQAHIFRIINRPAVSLNISKIISGLRQFRKEFKGRLWLELMFVKGVNDSKANILKLKKIINQIDPDKVFVKTVTRPGQQRRVCKLDVDELKFIQNFFGKSFTQMAQNKIRADFFGGLEDTLLAILRRHPATFKDLFSMLKVDRQSLRCALDSLLDMKRIATENYTGQIFYIVKQ